MNNYCSDESSSDDSCSDESRSDEYCCDEYCSGDEEILIRPMIKCKNRKCSFRIHRNPPKFFNPKDKKYCCSLCRLSNNYNHGGHCENLRFISK